MGPQQWQQVKLVFQAALELPPEKRSAFVVESCADLAVRREVESQLASAADSDGFLAEAADRFVPELLEEAPDANIGRRIGLPILLSHSPEVSRPMEVHVVPPHRVV